MMFSPSFAASERAGRPVAAPPRTASAHLATPPLAENATEARSPVKRTVNRRAADTIRGTVITPGNRAWR